jgi:hypothetical protein
MAKTFIIHQHNNNHKISDSKGDLTYNSDLVGCGDVGGGAR